MATLKIRKGDTVKIMAGKDAGATGKVQAVLVEKMQVIIEGKNLRKKIVKAARQGEKGQRVEFAAPMHISNVMVIDPASGKPTRVGFQIGADGKKVRISKRSKQPLD